MQRPPPPRPLQCLSAVGTAPPTSIGVPPYPGARGCRLPDRASAGLLRPQRGRTHGRSRHPWQAAPSGLAASSGLPRASSQRQSAHRPARRAEAPGDVRLHRCGFVESSSPSRGRRSSSEIGPLPVLVSTWPDRCRDARPPGPRLARNPDGSRMGTSRSGLDPMAASPGRRYRDAVDTSVPSLSTARNTNRKTQENIAFPRERPHFGNLPETSGGSGVNLLFVESLHPAIEGLLGHLNNSGARRDLVLDSTGHLNQRTLGGELSRGTELGTVCAPLA